MFTIFNSLCIELFPYNRLNEDGFLNALLYGHKDVPWIFGMTILVVGCESLELLRSMVLNLGLAYVCVHCVFMYSSKGVLFLCFFAIERGFRCKFYSTTLGQCESGILSYVLSANL
jgi:hypothetical protein